MQWHRDKLHLDGKTKVNVILDHFKLPYIHFAPTLQFELSPSCKPINILGEHTDLRPTSVDSKVIYR